MMSSFYQKDDFATYPKLALESESQTIVLLISDLFLNDTAACSSRKRR